jgi:hypothetical protein
VKAGVCEDFAKLREALHVAGVQGVDLLLRLSDGGAGLQSPDHRPVVAMPAIV